MKQFITLIVISFIFSSEVFAFSFNKSKETVQFSQSEQYAAITQQANVLYAENNIKGAQNLLLSIPENQRIDQNWLLLGNIFQDQGKIDDAAFMYRRAIMFNDNYYKAHYNLANLYLNDDKPNMAIEEYLTTLKIKPDYAYAHYNLACAYIKVAKYSKAKFELYNAIDLKNNEPDFYYNLIYVLKMQNKEKEAKKYVEIYNKLTGESDV